MSGFRPLVTRWLTVAVTMTSAAPSVAANVGPPVPEPLQLVATPCCGLSAEQIETNRALARKLKWSFYGLHVADLATTEIAISSGKGREANLILRDPRVRRFGSAAIAIAFGELTESKLAPSSDPRKAKAGKLLLAILTGLKIIVVGGNGRIAF